MIHFGIHEGWVIVKSPRADPVSIVESIRTMVHWVPVTKDTSAETRRRHSFSGLGVL
jgi:hypothetical protein